METKDFKVITDAVLAAIEPKGFKIEKFDAGEYISDGKRAFMVDYDDANKFISLKVSVLTEGEGVDWKTASTWMMDETADDKDKLSISNDFAETALEQIGAKATTKGIGKVEMPSKKKNAESIDVESFTARFLAVFPEHKDAYKNNISKYGEFLYDDFFRKYGADALKNVIREGNKRHITKYLELLNMGYINGEKETETVIVYSIFASAIFCDDPVGKDVYTYLEKYPYLDKGVRHIKALLSNPKNKIKYM